MKSFWIRLTSVILLAASVLVYNGVLRIRAQEAEIAELTAKVEGYESWEQEVREAMETAVAGQADQAAVSDEAGEDEEEESGLVDGTYSGQAQGFGGTISVSVTVASGAITDIEITSASGEDSAYLSMAKKVIDDMISSQSVDVDTVSGATFSSTGIINAVADAMSQAIE